MDESLVGARVLVVDDDRHICRALAFALRAQGYDVRVAHTAESALSLVEDWTPDLFVVDVRLPGIDGFALVSALRRDVRFQASPIILLTAFRRDASSRATGLNLGASDYLVKPFSLEELLARIRANLRAAGVTLRLEEAVFRLSELATRDPLTGLYHHGSILGILLSSLMQAIQEDSYLACIMLDIDNFKRINDTFGHEVGDSVIVALARLLVASCRYDDECGRYGGDEFLVVLPYSSAEAARDRAESLRVSLAEASFPPLPPGVRVTASFGVASACDSALRDGSALIDRADHALSLAKRAGGNHVVCWRP